MPKLVNEGTSRLVLEAVSADYPASGELEAYVIVQPVNVGSELGDVQVWHADGCVRTQVECLRPDDRPDNSAVLGISQDFSLEMAIKDALAQVAPNPRKEPQLFEVVSMGALYGGFSGFSRIFVRMAPADTYASAPQEMLSRDTGKRRRHTQECRTRRP